MKKLLLLTIISCFTGSVAMTQYWQQEVNYRIDVSLRDKDHSLDGFERIEYINNSPDTLSYIWFHIWPNAYKNDQTAFSDQLLRNNKTDFYFSNADQKGYINRLDFKVNNITARIEDHPQHIDIIKLNLPEPLLPGKKIEISTPFHVRLPYNFSRGGHDGESYQVTQWYPKPAVYDQKGWHAMPYLDQGEFYSEFGKFDVSITVPKNYLVAATGILQNSEEAEWLSSLSKSGNGEKLLTAAEKKAAAAYPVSSAETKTLRYLQDKVHDFAWFADKRFTVRQDSLRLPSGRIISVQSFATNEYAFEWRDAVRYAKNAILFYSDQVGEYPYDIATVVQGPKSFGGGMEYPTITVLSPGSEGKSLDKLIAHELGHNWFYGILANNERDNPWMDEGFNSYIENKYAQSKYGKESEPERLLLETRTIQKTDQAIALPSDSFRNINYYLIPYYKTAAWLALMEDQLGEGTMKKVMQEYFNQWKFKHPGPDDFRDIAETVSQKDLDSYFTLLHTRGNLPNLERKGATFAIFPGQSAMGKYFITPTKHLITVSAALGYNSYDKFMIGGLITNYKLPPSPFQFLLIPMYGTGSKEFAGLGRVSQTFYTDGLFRKIEISVAGSKFSMDEFVPDSGSKVTLGFQKIVPGIKLVLKEKDPRSTLQRYFQWKTFLIGEDRLTFKRDTLVPPPNLEIVERYGTRQANRYMNQFRFVIDNNRALYPYSGELRFEQAKDILRTTFTGKYFFNYPSAGGLDVRLFAGKFFYTSEKTVSKQFANDRYHLNMTGPNGFEDYTYSDYFLGRNKFEGFTSQQIMVRDGAFKVRTDLLADKIGRSDDWLVATNLVTTIPSGLNPLSMLPVKIPLKIFLDIGTYADAWEKDAEGDRFLFDAGLQVSLFKETVNIYFPLIYSKVFKDYIQSTLEKKGRFWKTVSFSIDISNFKLRRVNQFLDF